MKLLKPTWVNHNGECAGAASPRPGRGLRRGGAAVRSSHLAPARAARVAGPAGADSVLTLGHRAPHVFAPPHVRGALGRSPAAEAARASV